MTWSRSPIGPPVDPPRVSNMRVACHYTLRPMPHPPEASPDAPASSPAGAPPAEAGLAIPPFLRETGFANWNRFAAVNDEFIPIHMDDAAAVEVGQKAAFGMGNLRVAYLHDALEAWIDGLGGGTIVDLAAQFRGLNFKGDTLTTTGFVTG